jgi:trans-2,3-dihydro-3-hydroxyanthranilate isomerase
MNNPVFYIVDVFAERKYEGNQLAVFNNASALSSPMMQHIAREMNFSETTFILSGKEHDGGYDVRIFTPFEEVPFAGHPVLGTAHVIRTEILKTPCERLCLNLKAGKIPVTFEENGMSWMQQLEPEFGSILDAEQIAEVLGLGDSDIDGRFPAEEVSTGLPFIIVPLKTINALKRARINREKLSRLIENTKAKMIFIFCPETHEPGNHVSCRMFGDDFGITEDPATGSANGCLAGYLVRHRYFGGPEICIRSEQGYEIGRPSLLYLKASEKDRRILILVGGKSVIVAKGEFV